MAKQAPLLTVLKFFGDAPAQGSLPVFVAKQGQFGVDFGLHLNGHAPLLALAAVVVVLGLAVVCLAQLPNNALQAGSALNLMSLQQ